MLTRFKTIFQSPLLLLLGILILGFFFRFMGINWDDHSHLHPDERFLTGVVNDIGSDEDIMNRKEKDCTSEDIWNYFHTQCSNLNPNNVMPGSFAYGTLPLFIVRGVGTLMAEQNPAWLSYDYLHFVGRGVNAVADTLAILMVYLIGARLFTQRQALIAAALYAFAVMPIQLAHFWTVDIIAHLFFTVGIYAAVEICLTGRAWAFVLFGLALGCALASRVNLAPMVILLPLAVAIFWLNTRRRLMLLVVLSLFSLWLGFMTFRVFQPYAFDSESFADFNYIDTFSDLIQVGVAQFQGETFENYKQLNPKWVSDIIEVSKLSQDYSDGWPPSNQWYGRVKYAYAWYNMSRWGMGILLGLVATLSLVYAIYQFALIATQFKFTRWRIQTPPIPPYALFIAWIAIFFGYQGGIHQMTMRYYLPLYVVLCLLATWGMFHFKGLSRKTLVLAVVISTLIWAYAFSAIYRQPLSRLEASAWVVENFPTTITFENENGHLNGELSNRLTFPLMTLVLQESYVSQVYTVPANLDEVLGVEFLFSDPHAALVNLRLLDIEDSTAEHPLMAWEIFGEDNQVPYQSFEGQVDFKAGEEYLWHLDTLWEEGGNLRYMLPLLVWRDKEGNIQRTGLQFLSPYSPVPYAHFSDSQPLEILADEAFEVQSIFMPHVINPSPELFVRVHDQTTTATLDETVNPEALLGEGIRYQLDEPLTIDVDKPMRLFADTAMFVTGTAIANEGAWDDGIPWSFCKGLGEKSASIYFEDCDSVNAYSLGYYPEIPLQMAENDFQIKYLRMIDILNKVDYLTISSNRFYDALPRNERRFPLSTRYYELLFEGKLNYELIETFSSFPSILGVEMRDQVLPTVELRGFMNELEAEEAFHVYDHPTVFIFENDGFTPSDLPENFSYVDPRNRIDLSEARYNTVNLSENPVTSGQTLQITLMWIFGLWLTGWLGYPLIWRLFPRLPLRGFAFGRGISWLTLTLIPWWLTATTGFNLWSRGAVWVLVLAYLALNAWILWQAGSEWLAYLLDNRRGFLAMEGLFFAALAMGILLRAVAPDLWHPARGGEKPMDFAYLNAVLRTAQFPPPNPWLSGFEINYYYFGFVIAALPIKLGNFAPEVGVNLALSSLYAVVAIQVFTLSYLFLPVSRWRIPFAGLGMSFVMLMGNLGAFYLLLNPEPNMHPNRWFWLPTRLIAESKNGGGGAINEVPFFSFIYGDLHAHIIALLPVTLFILVLWLLVARREMLWGVILGVLASVIYMTNTWDILIYVPLATILMWISTRSLPKFLRLAVWVALGGIVTIAPYYLQFTLGNNGGIELWKGEKTLFEPFLLVWGIPLSVVCVWLIYRLKAILTPEADSPVEIGLLILGLVVVLGVYASSSTSATTALCLLLVVLALILMVLDTNTFRPFHALIVLMFVLLAAIEYIVIQGDVGRLNTVFKITFQLWLWFGLLIPPLLYYILVEQKLYIMGGICLIFLALGLVYPIQSIPARHEDSETGNLTLNGNLFMNTLILYDGNSEIVVSRDADLVRWMRANIQGFPVVAEWYEREYWWNSRVAMETGLPSVVGWANHLRQQYTHQSEEVSRRIIDIQTLYQTTERDTIERIINDYQIKYIVVSELENSMASPEALAIFENMLADGRLGLAYDRGFSRVYRVEPVQAE